MLITNNLLCNTTLKSAQTQVSHNFYPPEGAFKSFAKNIVNVTSTHFDVLTKNIDQQKSIFNSFAINKEIRMVASIVVPIALMSVAGTPDFLTISVGVGVGVKSVVTYCRDVLSKQFDKLYEKTTTAYKDLENNLAKFSIDKKNLVKNFSSALEQIRQDNQDKTKAFLKEIPFIKNGKNSDHCLNILKERYVKLQDNIFLYEKENRSIIDMLKISNTKVLEEKANKIKENASYETRELIDLLIKTRLNMKEEKGIGNLTLVDGYIKDLNETISKKNISLEVPELNKLKEYLQDKEQQRVNKKFEKLKIDLEKVLKDGKYSPHGFGALGKTDVRKVGALHQFAGLVQQRKHEPLEEKATSEVIERQEAPQAKINHCTQNVLSSLGRPDIKIFPQVMRERSLTLSHIEIKDLSKHTVNHVQADSKVIKEKLKTLSNALSNALSLKNLGNIQTEFESLTDKNLKEKGPLIEAIKEMVQYTTQKGKQSDRIKWMKQVIMKQAERALKGNVVKTEDAHNSQEKNAFKKALNHYFLAYVTSLKR